MNKSIETARRGAPLRAGRVYHVLNRGNNGENLFIEARNYSYFLRLYGRYVAPMAINKAYGRTGKLFQEHFARIEVTHEAYFVHLIHYIHFNPQKHGFVDDFRDWPWSSYAAFLSHQDTQLQREREVHLPRRSTQRHRGCTEK